MGFLEDSYKEYLSNVADYCDNNPEYERLFEEDLRMFIYQYAAASNCILSLLVGALKYADIDIPDTVVLDPKFTITGKQFESKGVKLANPYPRNACVDLAGQCFAWGASNYGRNSKGHRIDRVYFETAQEAQDFLDKFVTLPRVIDRDNRVGHIEWKVTRAPRPGYKVKINTECGPCLVGGD